MNFEQKRRIEKSQEETNKLEKIQTENKWDANMNENSFL